MSLHATPRSARGPGGNGRRGSRPGGRCRDAVGTTLGGRLRRAGAVLGSDGPTFGGFSRPALARRLDRGRPNPGRDRRRVRVRAARAQARRPSGEDARRPVRRGRDARPARAPRSPQGVDRDRESASGEGRLGRAARAGTDPATAGRLRRPVPRPARSAPSRPACGPRLGAPGAGLRASRAPLRATRAAACSPARLARAGRPRAEAAPGRTGVRLAVRGFRLRVQDLRGGDGVSEGP